MSSLISHHQKISRCTRHCYSLQSQKFNPRFTKNNFPQIRMFTQAKESPSSNSSSSNSSSSTKQSQSFFNRIYNEINKRKIQYATIPSIAAFVGISTNYMGVQMLFYPIEYIGTTGDMSFRILDDNSNTDASENVSTTDASVTTSTKIDTDMSTDGACAKYAPYGFIGWQGVVPARTEKMALRLVDIVTKKLLSLKEAFSRLDNKEFANLMTAPVLETVERDCGKYWSAVLKPVLPFILQRVVKELQKDIEDVLDLEKVVLNAFVRDKVVLVELFQNVGRVELDFLVKSGFGFGFLLGIGQMALWVVQPRMWTLPVAGALVGYVTNWIAIKLLFEPADPVDLGPFVLQGLFESRQVEVSQEFAHFMESRVLSSPMLLDALTNQNEEEMFQFLRKQLPWPIPEHVLRAAMEAIRTVAANPEQYKHIHSYVSESLDIEDTLSSRLKKLSPKNFEDLLHPVFQEDEIILIVTGGVLGALAGLLQTRLGWGGPNAKIKAAFMLVGSMAASAFFFVLPDAEEILKKVKSDMNINSSGDESDQNDPVVNASKPTLKRRNSLLRKKLE
jgi:uncharacterized membrane protein YheB (UPF0754 family)